mmetsp:Transcript_29992/g.96776  ORF Transcript_29992/g.96776 Transcript_29992/m.96776 type:complete len:229 (-) Transcript_29992:678-1364(-)
MATVETFAPVAASRTPAAREASPSNQTTAVPPLGCRSERSALEKAMASADVATRQTILKALVRSQARASQASSATARTRSVDDASRHTAARHPTVRAVDRRRAAKVASSLALVRSRSFSRLVFAWWPEVSTKFVFATIDSAPRSSTPWLRRHQRDSPEEEGAPTAKGAATTPKSRPSHRHGDDFDDDVFVDCGDDDDCGDDCGDCGDDDDDDDHCVDSSAFFFFVRVY